MTAVLVSLGDLKTSISGGGGSLYEDSAYQQVADAAENALVSVLDGDAADFAAVPEVREVALNLAIDLWQSRQTAASTGVGIDLSPFQLGSMMVKRYYGAIQQHLDPALFVDGASA